MGFFSKLFGGSRDNNQFTPTAELLNEDKFWTIIHKTHNHSNGDFEQQLEELAKQLRKLSLQDIVLFENRFRQLHGRAYTWELWGAIYLIRGGCSDDGFSDFRDWLIAQGKPFYYKIVGNPEALVNIDAEKFEIDWEGFAYIASTVFNELTGVDIPAGFSESHEITGKEWKEQGDDLKIMFPLLYQKYAQ